MGDSTVHKKISAAIGAAVLVVGATTLPSEAASSRLTVRPDYATAAPGATIRVSPWKNDTVPKRAKIVIGSGLKATTFRSHHVARGLVIHAPSTAGTYAVKYRYVFHGKRSTWTKVHVTVTGSAGGTGSTGSTGGTGAPPTPTPTPDPAKATPAVTVTSHGPINLGASQPNFPTYSLSGLPSGTTAATHYQAYVSSSSSARCSGTPYSAPAVAMGNGSSSTPRVASATTAGYYTFRIVVDATPTSNAVTSPCSGPVVATWPLKLSHEVCAQNQDTVLGPGVPVIPGGPTACRGVTNDIGGTYIKTHSPMTATAYLDATNAVTANLGGSFKLTTRVYGPFATKADALASPCTGTGPKLRTTLAATVTSIPASGRYATKSTFGTGAAFTAGWYGVRTEFAGNAYEPSAAVPASGCNLVWQEKPAGSATDGSTGSTTPVKPQ